MPVKERGGCELASKGLTLRPRKGGAGNFVREKRCTEKRRDPSGGKRKETAIPLSMGKRENFAPDKRGRNSRRGGIFPLRKERSRAAPSSEGVGYSAPESDERFTLSYPYK